MGESVILETATLKVEVEAQSQCEIAREAFADSVPLHDPDDKLEKSFNAVHELRAINASRSDNGIPAVAPDVASLLRKRVRKRCQQSRR